MNEMIINCPKCNQTFNLLEQTTIDGHVKQEIDKALQAAKNSFDKELETAKKLVTETTTNLLKDELHEKDRLVLELNVKLTQIKEEKENAIKLAIEETKNLSKDELSSKTLEIEKIKAANDKSISELQAKIDLFERDKKLEISQIISEEQEKHTDLKVKIAEQNTKFAEMESNYKGIIAYKDKEIERVEKMKKSLSTKALGESLEIYCQNEFNKICSSAFPNAFFQ